MKRQEKQDQSPGVEDDNTCKTCAKWRTMAVTIGSSKLVDNQRDINPLLINSNFTVIAAHPVM